MAADVMPADSLSPISPPPAGYDAVLNRPEQSRVQLHPRSGRRLLSHRPRPAAEHLSLLHPRPHLRLQL